jgi:hypothetical protein
MDAPTIEKLKTGNEKTFPAATAEAFRPINKPKNNQQ